MGDAFTPLGGIPMVAFSCGVAKMENLRRFSTRNGAGGIAF